ncbi:hypothetical protein L204_106061 [Cryptococcus depauperatus]
MAVANAACKSSMKLDNIEYFREEARFHGKSLLTDATPFTIIIFDSWTPRFCGAFCGWSGFASLFCLGSLILFCTCKNRSVAASRTVKSIHVQTIPMVLAAISESRLAVSRISELSEVCLRS